MKLIGNNMGKVQNELNMWTDTVSGYWFLLQA
jgi:hypothetical protein